VIDRNAKVRTFEFDGLNRQTHERWMGGNNNNSVLRDIVSSYDAAGQLTRLSDPDATYDFGYDLMGRLKSVDNNGTPARVVLTYDYDSNGNVKSVQDAINGSNAGMTSYDYDGLNRVRQITQSGTGVQNKRVNFAYNSVGQMQSLKRYSDLGGNLLVAQTGYTYDSLNRLGEINHTNSAGSSLSLYRFGYDAAGRITRMQSLFAGVNASFNDETNYTYDKTSQLQGADHSAIADESYAYDANGNRTTAGHSTGTDNRLQSDGVYTYTYDNEGNLIQRVGNGTTRTFTWDYRNRLTEVRDNGSVTAAYTYDAMNRRISKSVGGTTTRFVYDRDNVLLEFTGRANAYVS
jgi:YD repeat-containing protein